MNKTIGNQEFDKTIGSDFFIYSFTAKGIKPSHTYIRNNPNQNFWDNAIESIEKLSTYKGEDLDIAKMIQNIPVGSNIAITNLKANPKSSFRNENIIKLGDNLWGAHGFLGNGTYTLEQIKRRLAFRTSWREFKFPTKNYIEENIFISKIETLNSN